MDDIEELQYSPYKTPIERINAVSPTSRIYKYLNGHEIAGFFFPKKVIRPSRVSGAGNDPSNSLTREITKTFGSMENFRIEFEETAVKLFGSGWVFLVYDSNDGRLKVHSTASQDSVLLETGLGAIFGNDVWEHAYYLNYNNRRSEYLHGGGASWPGTLPTSVIRGKKTAPGVNRAAISQLN